MRRQLVFVALVLAAACSRAARKEATPPLASNVAAAAAGEAALRDPGAGPALTESEQIDHVLSRATFGARPGDRERVARLGIAAFLEEQLHPEALDDARVELQLKDYAGLHRGAGALAHELTQKRKEKQDEDQRKAKAEAAMSPVDEGPMTATEAARQAGQGPAKVAPEAAKSTPKRPGKEMRRALGRAGRGPGFDYVADLSEAKMVRAVASERQLQEVLVDFWFNHFNVFAGKENEAALLPDYEEQAIRPNALGSFRDLLDATAHSPAMLVYLDNRHSASAQLPERQRRFSGWYRGRRSAAVDPAKRPPPKARRGLNENYARELLELHTMGVDGGYTQQDIIEVARCFTGWTVDQPNEDPRFVFRAQMHDDGEKRVLGHLIRAGGGEDDGEQILKILLDHPATARFVATKLVRRFLSDDAPPEAVARVAATFTRTHGDIRSMLRTIFESPELWSRRALRSKVRSPLELVASSIRALGATVEDPLVLARAVARIGEPLYGAQPPTGYADTAAAWMSSGALLARIDFGLQLANGQLEGVAVNLSSLAQGAKGPGEVLQRAAEKLGARELSDETRSYILGQLQNAPVKPELLAARAVGLLLGAPELQRR